MKIQSNGKPFGNNFFENMPKDLQDSILSYIYKPFPFTSSTEDPTGDLSILNATKVCKQWNNMFVVPRRCVFQNIARRIDKKLIADAIRALREQEIQKIREDIIAHNAKLQKSANTLTTR